jgi:hypothetical protein
MACTRTIEALLLLPNFVEDLTNFLETQYCIPTNDFYSNSLTSYDELGTPYVPSKDGLMVLMTYCHNECDHLVKYTARTIEGTLSGVFEMWEHTYDCEGASCDHYNCGGNDRGSFHWRDESA